MNEVPKINEVGSEEARKKASEEARKKAAEEAGLSGDATWREINEAGSEEKE